MPSFPHYLQWHENTVCVYTCMYVCIHVCMCAYIMQKGKANALQKCLLKCLPENVCSTFFF